MENRDQSTTASGLNVIAGLWLIIAPAVLGYVNSTPRTNDIILGIVIGVLSLIRVFTPLRAAWVSGINILLGLWLIISPWVLGYANVTPRWNDVLLGIIVAALAIWSSSASVTTTRPAA